MSGQLLPPPDKLRQIHSQLDLAPSIVHLLGWPVPEGWWRESVFESAINAPSISKVGKNLMVAPLDGPRQVVSLNHPNGAAEQGLVKLFLSIYTNSSPAEAAAGTGLPVNSP